jgi:hypothetical protein
MIKIVLYRGFGVDIKSINHFVGQHEEKVVDLLQHREYNSHYLDAFMLIMNKDDLSRHQS